MLGAETPASWPWQAQPPPLAGTASPLALHTPGTPNPNTLPAPPPSRTFLLKIKDGGPLDLQRNLGVGYRSLGSFLPSGLFRRGRGPDSILSEGFRFR